MSGYAESRHHDRSPARRLLGGPDCLCARRDDDVHVQLDEFERKGGEPVSPPLRPSPLHRDIAAVDVTQFAHSLAKALPQLATVHVAEDSNAGNLCGQLRKGGEGRGEKTARERADERAPVNH